MTPASLSWLEHCWDGVSENEHMLSLVSDPEQLNWLKNTLPGPFAKYDSPMATPPVDDRDFPLTMEHNTLCWGYSNSLITVLLVCYTYTEKAINKTMPCLFVMLILSTFKALLCAYSSSGSIIPRFVCTHCAPSTISTQLHCSSAANWTS